MAQVQPVQDRPSGAGVAETTKTLRKPRTAPLPRAADLVSAFGGAPVGLFRTRSDGTLLDANPTLVRLLGYPSRAALLAINARDLYVHPEDRDRTLTRLNASDSLHDAEMQLRRADGQTIWVTEHVRAVRDADGRMAVI